MKVRLNISVDEETDKKLRQFAAESHTTVSQWITDRVWEKEKEQRLEGKNPRNRRNKGV